MTQTHPIRCRCGQFQAEVALGGRTLRAVCYCHDCQSFAHFLGRPEGMLEALGGTDIVAAAPRHVSLRAGSEQLACMSLSPQGVLRWYARCCRTPIGNTPRDPRTSHVGVAILGYLRSLLAARIGGGWRRNPFFDEAGKPRVEVQVITREDREALLRGVRAG